MTYFSKAPDRWSGFLVDEPGVHVGCGASEGQMSAVEQLMASAPGEGHCCQPVLEIQVCRQ